MTEEQVGAAIAAAARTVHAPAELRERLAAPPRRRRPLVGRLALTGAAAAVLAAFVLLVTGGGPTVEEVAQASLKAPTRPASAGLAEWGTERGWTPVGERVDRVQGRRAVTAIYRRGGRGVHYAVLDGSPVDVPDGRRVDLRGREYTVLRDGATAIVTWRRDGRTCVLASKMVGADDLVALLRGDYAGR